ncbi:MAG: sodium:proton antiporter [Halanaerobiales bacterium]|nr:sodium:proton antiporter [Halanaerobiales bacterium]
MDGSWLALIPFLVVIPVAIWTKQIIPGLTLGLLIGSYLVEPTILGGLQKTLSYLIKTLQEENNLKIIIFLYLFSGLIEIIKISGGIKGFVEYISVKINTKTSALLLTWFSVIGTFSAPTFRIVTITPIMKALLQRIKLSTQELGFMIEVTSTPIIVLIPIATAFVGYMISLIELALTNYGLEGNAYNLFIQSIPFNFFSIAMISLGLYLSFFHRSTDREMSFKNTPPDAEDWHECHPVVSDELPSKPLNLIIPIILSLVLTFVITWWDGYQKTANHFKAFLEADVLAAMVISLIITFFCTTILFLFQKIALTEIISHFICGGNELMKIILLLTLVWGISAVTEDLGLSALITNHTAWVPKQFVPPIIFIIGAILSYFIGSSWGTWGILMPLGMSLAQVAASPFPLIIGAIFAGGTFGAFASPLSGNTVTIAKILNLPLLEYTKYKLKPALIAAGVSVFLYLISAILL